MMLRKQSEQRHTCGEVRRSYIWISRHFCKVTEQILISPSIPSLLQVTYYALIEQNKRQKISKPSDIAVFLIKYLLTRIKQ